MAPCLAGNTTCLYHVPQKSVPSARLRTRTLAAGRIRSTVTGVVALIQSVRCFAPVFLIPMSDFIRRALKAFTSIKSVLIKRATATLHKQADSMDMQLLIKLFNALALHEKLFSK